MLSKATVSDFKIRRIFVISLNGAEDDRRLIQPIFEAGVVRIGREVRKTERGGAERVPPF